MSTERISFLAPAGCGWRRMTEILFRPFDLRKWLVLGFTAWLAGLDSCTGGGSGGGDGGDHTGDDGRFETLGRSAADVWQTLAASPFWLGIAAFGCLLLVCVVLLVLWVSSRGKFLFLDNVVYDRARVVDPWKRFRRQGNSLFGFTLALVAAVVLLCGGGLVAIAATVGWRALDEPAPSIGLAVVVVPAGAVLVGLTLYTIFFLEAFVVPLMHRYDLGVVDGWRRFLRILRQRPLPFFVCGLLVALVGVGVLVAIFTFGLLTCCLGLLLLVIPYVGSVLLLPVSVFYRSFTLEFLAQLEPDLLPVSEAEPG